MEELTKLFKKISDVQAELKVPKTMYNSFGKYNYRNCEGILEAAKPICKKNGLILFLSDEIVCVGEKNYVQAKATIADIDTGVSFAVYANAREAIEKKGMDDSQITGTASSYARKYALNGLFNLDDTKDADTDEYANETKKSMPKKEYKCVDCGKAFEPFTDKNGKTWTAGQVYHMSESSNSDGKARCKECRMKHEALNAN